MSRHPFSFVAAGRDLCCGGVEFVSRRNGICVAAERILYHGVGNVVRFSDKNSGGVGSFSCRFGAKMMPQRGEIFGAALLGRWRCAGKFSLWWGRGAVATACEWCRDGMKMGVRQGWYCAVPEEVFGHGGSVVLLCRKRVVAVGVRGRRRRGCGP